MSPVMRAVGDQLFLLDQPLPAAPGKRKLRIWPSVLGNCTPAPELARRGPRAITAERPTPGLWRKKDRSEAMIILDDPNYSLTRVGGTGGQ
jgi:hypothetical protein